MQGFRPCHGGVANDHAVDPARARYADDVIEVGQRKIGRDLEQHWCRPGGRRDAFARIDHARQQLVEHGGLLHIPQAGRIGRRDVDRDIARHRGEALDEPHIIGNAIGCILVGADVDADDAARSRPRSEPAQHGVGALRIKAEAIDDAGISIEPKQPRPRIATLRLWRDGADFDETEADAQQRVRHFGVFVEASGDPDRIGEVEPEHPHRQPLIVDSGRRHRCEFQQPDCQTMRIFRVERVQKRSCQTVEQADHGFSSGSARRPSTSSGKGCAQSTALIGSAA